MQHSLLVLTLFLCTATLAAQEPVSPKQETAVHVVTYLDLLPDQADPGRLLLIHAVQTQQKQSGCLSAELLQEQARVNHFMLVEAWRDPAALKGWRASGDYRQFRASLAIGTRQPARRTARPPDRPLKDNHF